MWWYDDGGSWGLALMTAGMVLLWALLIVIAVALIRSWRPAPGEHAATAETRPSAEQILAERLARGEIGEADYRERLAVLHDSQSRVDGAASRPMTVPPDGPPTGTD